MSKVTKKGKLIGARGRATVTLTFLMPEPVLVDPSASDDELTVMIASTVSSILRALEPSTELVLSAKSTEIAVWRES